MAEENNQPSEKTKYNIKEWLISTLMQKLGHDDLIALSVDHKKLIS